MNLPNKLSILRIVLVPVTLLFMLPVNICSVSDDGIFYIGRSYGESPEVDPVIYIASQDGELQIGDFVEAKIVDCSDDYDMTAVTV